MAKNNVFNSNPKIYDIRKIVQPNKAFDSDDLNNYFNSLSKNIQKLIRRSCGELHNGIYAAYIDCSNFSDCKIRDGVMSCVEAAYGICVDGVYVGELILSSEYFDLDEGSTYAEINFDKDNCNISTYKLSSAVSAPLDFESVVRSVVSKIGAFSVNKKETLQYGQYC